jgi:CO/xanthine dehydrogenase Mo-binding subunit
MAVTRRGVLIGTAVVAGGGLALTWLRPDPRAARLATDPAVLEPNAWLQVAPDGTITLQVDKAELGQGVVTGYVTLVAEELDVPPADITAQLAPVHPFFQDPTQVTAESKSMRSRAARLRATGAAAREMLVAAAAARLGVAPAALATDGTGHVVHAATGGRLAYAELAAAAALLPVPEAPALRERAAWRQIGTRVPRPDVPDKVRGAATYGIDVRLPGLLVAVVARSHAFGGGVAGYDAAAARALPGVHAVVEIASGVAVVAESFWHARRGAEALAATWTAGPAAGVSTAWVHGEHRRLLATGRGERVREDGDPDAAFAAAGTPALDAEYTFPYLAHATMEPMNCTVALGPGRAEVWAPTQGPDMAREVVRQLTGLAREQVTVHSTFCGGGFGRRAMMDYVAEAVAIAQRVDRPVKLVWPREDDTRHSWFRQALVHRVKALAGPDGRPVAWSHRLVAASIGRQILPAALPVLLPEALPRPAVRWLAGAAGFALERLAGPFQARDGSATMPYAVPDVAVDIVPFDSGVPIGIWRSVGNSYNAFVVESAIDELAAAAGADPAGYRRALLAGKPRHLAVLAALVEKAGWGAPPPGRFQGLALHEAFGSVVGQVAEISIEPGAARHPVRVHRVTCVVDCGTAINPDVVAQQMEGGIVFGLTAALFGEIRIENGRALESNFHDYRMLTLADAPAIDVHIVDTGAETGGVGESGVPPIAPAVANAVFRATGRRLRSLPLRL